MSTIILVDERDQIVGYKERRDRVLTDIIRATGLWVFRAETKEVLIARRSMSKPYDKGKWGPSAAGTLEQGETYTSNVVKEAREEIGLKIDPAKLIKGKYQLIQATQRYFYQGFFYEVPVHMLSNFTLQKDEVDEVRFVQIEKLIEWVTARPQDFIESFGRGLQDHEQSTLTDILGYLKNI